MRRFVLLVLLLTFAACDHGLEPPDAVSVGAIRASITYTGTWPSDSLFDLRFFALPFVPQDTLDLFRDINALVFSDRLAYNVDSATVFVDSVTAQIYVYSGVAQNFSERLLDWRPVGLAPLYQVRPGEVMEVSFVVDFDNLPPFPPPPPGNAGKGEREKGNFRISNAEQGLQNIEGAVRSFNIQNSLFDIRYSFPSPSSPLPLSEARRIP